MIRRSFRPLLAFAAAALLFTASLTAPGQASADWLSGIERSLGAQQHEQMVEAFGGAYENPKVRDYVDSLGQFLARTSEQPDLDYTFTVLDSPMVNAFALPGGYVYVTRGLMALAENEAELAGVLAHEIGHVNARHGLNRVGAGIFGELAALGLGLLLGEEAAAFGSSVAELGLRAYSRDQEYEADILGVQYLARAGYDPQAMAGFLDNLLRQSRLEAEIAGSPGAPDAFNIMATHPRTADRIEEAIRQAGSTAVVDPMTARDLYLEKIDGMLYGDSPEEGFVRGRSFLHSHLRFAFEVPEGFRLLNGQTQVIAVDSEGVRVVFDRARPESADLLTYLQREWAGQEVSLEQLADFVVDGLPAASGLAKIETRQGSRHLRLAAIRMPDDTVYRFLFVSTPEQSRRYADAFVDTLYSFRRLSEAEAQELKPQRLVLHRVEQGENVASLARRLPFANYREARLRALNGLSADQEVQAGQTVKLVVQ
ncbi:M48 family metalloprotease [Algihabitans albus]|uniref:M48 family metalloprotease n=1 Tax=Algihabitans albus TaxID=2164067 RepID=UPI000E5D6B93|nr:M48 family metalloprotease [Algihabitans albus]